MLLDEGLSYREIEKKTGVPKSIIHRWITIFAENMPVESTNTMLPKRIPCKRAPLEPPTNGVMSEQGESADEKIARLERELENEKLRSELYKEIINVAEKNFNISIIKKAGTKQ